MRKFSFVVVSLIGTLFAVPSLASCCVDVAVTITPGESEGGTVLNVRLTNNASDQLEVNGSLLPWGNRYSLILVAVRERKPNEQLKQKFFIDDIGPENVLIQPKQSLEGQIDVREFFQDVEAELAKGSVILMWSYQLVTTNKQESGRVAGWVRLTGRK